MDANTLTQRIEHLRDTFRSGKTKPAEWRRGQLMAIRRMFNERYGDFEKAMQADLHKSVFECFATEIGFLDREAGHALKHLDSWMSPKRTSTPVFLQPGASRVIFEPLGVALIMGAWNYPLQLTLGPLVAAIAAGNAAVIKPPRTAAATFKAVADILPQYLDPDAFLVITDDTPNELILNQRWDKIFFTGSAAVGKIVLQAASNYLTPVTLELGGKSPAIVDQTANLRVAARRIAQGKFFNAGQTCVAPDYVLVQEEVRERLLDELTRVVVEFFGSKPIESKDYARIINSKQFDKLVTYLTDGELVCGGESRREDRYIAPTILKNVSPNSPVMQSEIFGPILPVLAVKNVDEALAFVQAREKPLAFYFFSEDKNMVKKVLAQSTSGGACINETLNHLVVPGLPFGGVGNSGMGKYHGEWGFRDFSNVRGVLQRTPNFDLAVRYPPYSPENITLMKKLMGLNIPSFLEGPMGWLLDTWGRLTKS